MATGRGNEAAGATPDVWICIFTGDKRDVSTFLFSVAASGVPALLSKDADGKRWHIAVKGGLAANPAAYIASVRGVPDDVPACPAGAGSGHPQAGWNVRGR